MKLRTPLIRLKDWATTLLLGTALAARGALYLEGPWNSGFANGGIIPDGNPSGSWDTRTVSDIPADLTIGTVTVTFTITGGWNGDLYGYLSHGGVLIPLLNRVGQGTSTLEPTKSFGYGDAGFNGVTLADGAGVNIHNYGGGSVPSGTYVPDSGGVTFAGVFGGGNPDGDWTMFFVDLSGGSQSTLVSWSLGITAVPEPVNVALAVFGLFIAGVGVGRAIWARAKTHPGRGEPQMDTDEHR